MQDKFPSTLLFILPSVLPLFLCNCYVSCTLMRLVEVSKFNRLLWIGCAHRQVVVFEHVSASHEVHIFHISLSMQLGTLRVEVTCM